MVALHFAESNDELIVQKYNYQGCKSLTKDDDFLKKHEEAHPFFFRDFQCKKTYFLINNSFAISWPLIIQISLESVSCVEAALHFAESDDELCYKSAFLICL